MDASIPVIILTAKDELDEKINLLVAGADDYIDVYKRQGFMIMLYIMKNIQSIV